MLQNVERQQQVYRMDMKKTFSLRMAEIENIFYEMEQRGEQFLEIGSGTFGFPPDEQGANAGRV